MSPQVLAAAFELFGAALVLHVLFWRLLGPPKRHVPALLAVFFGPALAYALVFFGRREALDVCSVLLLHAALSCAYMQTYPAAQALSPSLQIVLIVASSRSGVAVEELNRRLAGRVILGERIDDLLAAGLLAPGRSAGTLAITRRGAMIVPPFLLLRKILGLELGRG